MMENKIKKTPELVVNFNKENYLSGLILMPIMILLATVGLFALPKLNVLLLSLPLLSSLAFIIVPVIKIVLCFCIGFFTLGFFIGILYSPFFLGHKGPAAILDQKGIWIKHHGFVPWNNIEVFSLYPIVGTLEAIKIQVKNIATLSKQSNWDGRLRIF